MEDISRPRWRAMFCPPSLAENDRVLTGVLGLDQEIELIARPANILVR
jgi:hypothetical protein